jgi:hypothetical protein
VSARGCDLPLVPVMPTARLRSYPKHQTGGAVQYMPLGQALTSTFPTDAHFADYSVPDIERRLTKNVAGLIDGGVHRVALTFDVDGAGHRATDEWWQSERGKIFDLLEVHPGGFVYRTRGGYRPVYALAAPIFIRDDADARAWRALYVSWCRYLARRFGIEADRKCKDWGRLFRLPRATRDPTAGPENREAIGDPHNIGTWHCELAAEDFATDEEQNTAKVRETPRTSNYSGPGRLVSAFDRRGWLGDELEPGKYAARCPWESDHTCGESFDSSTVIYEADKARGDLGWFHCAHKRSPDRADALALAVYGGGQFASASSAGYSPMHGDDEEVDRTAMVCAAAIERRLNLELDWRGIDQ